MNTFNMVKNTYSINEKEVETYNKWVDSLPKKLKKTNYVEWFMFSGSSGIGVAVRVQRTYSNGKVFETNITDYDSW